MPLNKVLIISHTFPPSPGIGGRRWAKFAKYLNREGVDLFILKEQRKSSTNQSPWTDDIRELKSNQIYTYKTFYPKILQKKHLGFWDKIYYKLAFLLVSLLTKGNPFDKVAFIKRRFLKQLDSIIKQNQIKNIIVSGAPFNLLYYCALYKESNPKINLIVDFRDGWTWDGRYGMNLLSEGRVAFEKEKEIYAVSFADIVLVSSKYHLEAIKFNHPYHSFKSSILSHAFDKDEFAEIDIDLSKDNFLIYGGTLYEHLEEVFKSLNRSFKNPKVVPLPIYLYLSNPNKLDEYLKLIDIEFHKYFIIKQPVSPKEFYKVVAKAKAFLFWGGVEIKISSKVYEVLYCKTPIIALGVKGELSDFLEENNLGLFYSPKDFCFSKICTFTIENEDFKKAERKLRDYSQITKELKEEIKL
jgi:hypothetical protein